jgi:preprotein translocase subunit SecA
MRGPDPTLARGLAGPDFRRADTLRDERGSEEANAVERTLRDLPGWWPPRPMSRARIGAWGRAIQAQAEALVQAPDADVVQAFQASLRVLKAQQAVRGDEPALARALACVGLASHRRLGMWPHPVQFCGASLLLRGRLAEMRTGEGKTLVAGLAATVMAGAGAAVHVVSTNDYLAQRDSEEMAALFAFFGLSVGHVVSDMDAAARRAAYQQAICYVSGKELVFDYLKDRLAGHGAMPWRVSHVRQAWMQELGASQGGEPPLIPALHFAIVDEADSVLIDEASTPMILSREVPAQYEPALMHWAVAAARGLQVDTHYRLLPARRLELLPHALDAVPPLPAGVRAVWQSRGWRETLLTQALTALHLYHRDQHYLVSDEGKVQIVDESTGRLMPDRSWEQGLHQMIETKEGVAHTAGRETLARMTFQRFFRRYYLLSGLTGTAVEASRELWSVYRLRVQRLPPHRPDLRHVWPSQCLPDAARKWQAVVDDALRAARAGQAVLIGTRSVEASEQVSAALTRQGVAHVVLNARQDAVEADIVAQAGAGGRITVATNMAGRGTDIKLRQDAREAGGLHVILTEFHESPRVDRQLFGRCGRQGDPGSVRAIVCADDLLFKDVPASWRLAVSRKAVAPATRKATGWGGWLDTLAWAVRWAQWRAEQRARAQRMQTLKQDRELSKLIGYAGPRA